MYRTEAEKFSVANNIDVSVIREEHDRTLYYALLKISIFGRNTFGICMLGDGYAFESIGEDLDEACAIFELILTQAPSVEHMFDIVTDFRRGRALED